MDQAIVIVPGIGNSGPDHWQSHWETAFPGAARIAPASWDAPDLADWTAGSRSAISTEMIAMTTNNSISVKPRRRRMKEMRKPPE